MAQTYDPITLSTILATLPEIRRRKSRAEQLRAVKDKFKEIEQTEGGPNYQPRQQGGLYPTVQRYQKDYAGAANKIVGALGGYMTNREQMGAEQDLGNLQDEQIIQAANQLGQTQQGNPQAGGLTDTALRAYLGMVGGDDIKNIMPAQARVHSTSKLANGNLGVIMSNSPNPIDTGMPYDYGIKTIEDAQGNVQAVGTSGAGRGVANPVQMGGAAQQQAPQGAPAPTTGPDDEAERWYQAVESVETGGHPDPTNATSPVGAKGPMQLMPPTARELERTLGLPEGSTNYDPVANRKAGRLYLDQRMQARNGNRELALMDYNWGMGKVDRWLANPNNPELAPPAGVREYVQKVTQRATGGQQAQAPSASSPASPSTLRVQTAGEKAAATEAAKIAANLAQAPQIAAAKGLDAEAQAMGKTRADIAQRLPGARNSVNQLKTATARLAANKDLPRILGGSPMGALSTFDEKGNISRSAKAIQSYLDPKGANVLAEYENVAGKVYKEAFETLKGGGPITEKETEAVSNAYARLQRTQDPAQFRAALQDMITNAEAGLAKLEAFGTGGSAPAAAPAAGGWKVRVKP